MAHSKQAKKRIRQNERLRLHNKAIASRMRSQVKRVLTLVEGGDKQGAEAAFPVAVKFVDKAAKRRVLHPNAASHKKSMMARAIHCMGA